MYIKRGFVLLALSFVVLFSTAAGFLGFRAGQAQIPPTVVSSEGYEQVRSAFLACEATLGMLH